MSLRRRVGRHFGVSQMGLIFESIGGVDGLAPSPEPGFEVLPTSYFANASWTAPSGPLREAPPTLVFPLQPGTAPDPQDSGKGVESLIPLTSASRNFDTRQDVLIVGGVHTPAGPRTSAASLKFGRNMRLLGLDIGNRKLSAQGAAGSVYIEGLRGDLATGPEDDALFFGGAASAGTSPAITVQYSHIKGVHGTDGVHTTGGSTDNVATIASIERTSGNTCRITLSAPFPSKANAADNAPIVGWQVICGGVTVGGQNVPIEGFNWSYTVTNRVSDTVFDATFDSPQYLATEPRPVVGSIGTGGKAWHFQNDALNGNHTDCIQLDDASPVTKLTVDRCELYSGYQAFISGEYRAPLFFSRTHLGVSLAADPQEANSITFYVKSNVQNPASVELYEVSVRARKDRPIEDNGVYPQAGAYRVTANGRQYVHVPFPGFSGSFSDGVPIASWAPYADLGNGYVSPGYSVNTAPAQNQLGAITLSPSPVITTTAAAGDELAWVDVDHSTIGQVIAGFVLSGDKHRVEMRGGSLVRGRTALSAGQSTFTVRSYIVGSNNGLGQSWKAGGGSPFFIDQTFTLNIAEGYADTETTTVTGPLIKTASTSENGTTYCVDFGSDFGTLYPDSHLLIGIAARDSNNVARAINSVHVGSAFTGSEQSTGNETGGQWAIDGVRSGGTPAPIILSQDAANADNTTHSILGFALAPMPANPTNNTVFVTMSGSCGNMAVHVWHVRGLRDENAFDQVKGKGSSAVSAPVTLDHLAEALTVNAPSRGRIFALGCWARTDNGGMYSSTASFDSNTATTELAVSMAGSNSNSAVTWSGVTPDSGTGTLLESSGGGPSQLLMLSFAPKTSVVPVNTALPTLTYAEAKEGVPITGSFGIWDRTIEKYRLSWQHKVDGAADNTAGLIPDFDDLRVIPPNDTYTGHRIRIGVVAIANGVESQVAWSAWSDPIADAVTAPAAITDLTAVVLASDAIRLDFTPPARAGTYQYRQNGGAWTALPADRIIAPLTAFTTYSFEVRARNSAGNANPSNTANATTKAVNGLVYYVARDERPVGLGYTPSWAEPAFNPQSHASDAVYLSQQASYAAAHAAARLTTSKQLVIDVPSTTIQASDLGKANVYIRGKWLPGVTQKPKMKLNIASLPGGIIGSGTKALLYSVDDVIRSRGIVYEDFADVFCTAIAPADMANPHDASQTGIARALPAGVTFKGVSGTGLAYAGATPNVAGNELDAGFDICDCEFINCLGAAWTFNDAAHLKPIKFQRNKLVGTFGGVGNMCAINSDYYDYGNEWSGVNVTTWARYVNSDGKPTNLKNSHYHTYFFTGSNSFSSLKTTRKHTIRIENNWAHDIYDPYFSGTANINAANFFDIRNGNPNMIGWSYGADRGYGARYTAGCSISVSYNVGENLVGTQGQEDSNWGYAKTLGILIEYNRIRNCGAKDLRGANPSSTRDGSECSAILLKNPGNWLTAAEMREYANIIRYNDIIDPPTHDAGQDPALFNAGLFVVKVDGDTGNGGCAATYIIGNTCRGYRFELGGGTGVHSAIWRVSNYFPNGIFIEDNDDYDSILGGVGKLIILNSANSATVGAIRNNRSFNGSYSANRFLVDKRGSSCAVSGNKLVAANASWSAETSTPSASTALILPRGANVRAA